MYFMYGFWFGLVLSTAMVAVCVYLAWRAFRHSQGLDRRSGRADSVESSLFGYGWTPDSDDDDAESVPWETGSGGGWALEGEDEGGAEEAWVRDPDFWKDDG